MNFKSYGTKKSTPQRMTRKRLRATVFIANKKAAKFARKVRRLERMEESQ